ncbi:hypothetical protein QBC43DRAFT_372097 [Cladorrhinum sp. PSN259]|nr:hypothetical protein QBC43DRAFT_372097 [Cladorrhinum sp. PSN259]
MALAPSTTLPLYPSHTLSLPLTTAWTVPPACTTAIPRFSQGTCVGTVCVTDQNPNTALVSAWMNWPYRTELTRFTSTECQPPGYNDRYLFAFVSATGCPSGYVTGAARTWPYDLAVSVVSCCPSSYTLSFFTPAFTDAYGSTTPRAECAAIRTLSPGAPYVGVAQGYNTQAVQTVVSGTSSITTTSYYTESVIQTATASSAMQIMVNQPYVQVLVPRSGGPATPTSTASSPSSTSSSSNTFSVFGLPYIISIVALVGIGIGTLLVLCCSCCIYRRCRRPRRYEIPVYRDGAPPARTPLVTAPAYGNGPLAAAAAISASSSSSICPHSRSSLCSYRHPYESTCCACKDSRPSSATMSLYLRTSTYCYACQTHFRSLPLAQIPPAWRTEADVDAMVEEIMERRKCRHGVVAILCSRTADESKTCCACIDVRPGGGQLTQEKRAGTYCEGCKEYYAGLEAEECPEEWKLGELDCVHGSGRSKNCKNATKEKYESACCVCKDTRVGTMPRGDRTALYCADCKRYWDGVEVEKLPAAWGIKCGHGDRYLRCKGGCAAGGKCCACVDSRRGGQMKKGERVAGYCEDCKDYWSGVDDAACPRAWGLKCRHGRANAWGVKGMQGAMLPGRLFGRRPAATGPCCCACGDTRTGFMTKIDRINNYCRDCKAFWSSKPDRDLPAEWQLSCRHGGMGAWCLTTGPNNTSQCCACLDTGRTKNMTKLSRLKTYCGNCQNTWWNTSDQQCPPEWNLLAPRNDCKHSMALECTMSPSGGETWCCACKDGRKFVNLPNRLATYCVPCGTHWSQEAARGNVPVGWTVTLKDIPIIFQKEGCLPRKPKVEYPFEDKEKYQGIFDEGPRYGPPRFSDGRPAAVELPTTTTAKKQTKNTVTVTITPLSPVGPEPDYAGYEEKGLQRGAPRFTVAPDPSWSPQAAVDPMSEKSAPAPPISAPAPKTAADKAASRAEKQRRKEQAGLCKGREPVFQVPPG